MRTPKLEIDFELIWKSVHDELSAAEQDQLQSWRAAHPSNERYYQQAVTFLEQPKGDNPIDIPEAWLGVLQKLEASSKRPFPWRALSGIAASILLLLTVVGYLYWNTPAEAPIVLEPITPGTGKAVLTVGNGQQFALSKGQQLTIDAQDVAINSDGQALQYAPKETSTSEVAYNTLQVPRGGEFFLVLADGTKVWVNADTRLRYPTRFGDQNRRVELKGEAYFEVTPDAARPFVVASAGQEITVLGTSFNVSAYDDDNVIMTTLVEGAVAIAHEAYDLQETLAPEEQAILKKSERSLIRTQVDPWQYIAWKENRFYFQDRPLQDIMTILSRWYDIDVFFDGTDISGIRFTGGFKRYQDFENVKELLEKTDEITMTIKGRTVIIR